VWRFFVMQFRRDPGRARPPANMAEHRQPEDRGWPITSPRRGLRQIRDERRGRPQRRSTHDLLRRIANGDASCGIRVMRASGTEPRPQSGRKNR
jgi:hypothetical protein